MRIDEYLYFTALILQLLTGILVFVSFLSMSITLFMSILVKGLAWQFADNKIKALEKQGESEK